MKQSLLSVRRAFDFAAISGDVAYRGLNERIESFRKTKLAEIDSWSRQRIGPVSHVSTGTCVAALTFDDGPHPAFTPMLLEVLSKYGAKATLFMLGVMAEKNPAIVRDAAREGHAIANHTFDHPCVPLISRSDRWRQLRKCSKALAPYERKLFRPPYGQRDLASCVDAWLMGYEVIAWNEHGHDWLDHDAEWMAAHMLANIKPGCIIALHDALYHTLDPRYTDRTATVRAVDLLLQRLAGSYQFVTVPDLLARGAPQRQSCFGKIDRDFLSNLQPSDASVKMHQYKLGRN